MPYLFSINAHTKVSISTMKLILYSTGMISQVICNNNFIGQNLCHSVVLIGMTHVLVVQFVHVTNCMHGSAIIKVSEFGINLV